MISVSPFSALKTSFAHCAGVAIFLYPTGLYRLANIYRATWSTGSYAKFTDAENMKPNYAIRRFTVLRVYKYDIFYSFL